VCYAESGEVLQTLEDLEGYQLYQGRTQFFTFYYLVEVVGVVVHHYIQVFFLSLEGSVEIAKFEDIGVFEGLQNLQLSIFVSFVL
jgi:hypothetical protein